MLFVAKFRHFLLAGLFISVLVIILVFSGYRLTAATLPTSMLLAKQTQSALSLTQDVQKTILKNGLTVLTKEVHTSPVVSVQVWYRLGSHNEGVGLNGIAHQLEHLMFKGTYNRPVQFGRLFSALGSDFNAFTSYDETAYFGTVQRDKLEALLTLEADRMEGSLLGTEQLKTEKKVVISELQGYENSPDYRLNRAVIRAAFPESSYGLTVGGTKSDVEKFTVEQVQEYYKAYYRPDNATLVITGDFDSKEVIQRVEQIFGQLPKREKIALNPVTTTRSSKTLPKNPLILKEPGSNALLQAVYPLPTINHPDVAIIDVMDAILTGGRSSRLYQSLVESGLASSVDASPMEMMESGRYEISVTGAPGQPLSKIEKVLQQSLADLQKNPVTIEELNRAKTELQTSFILGNQDITSQASQLGYYQTVAENYEYVEQYLNGITKVTAQDVQRIAQTYLNPVNQTLGFFEPTLPDGQPGTSSGGTTRTVENFKPGKPVDPAELAKYLPPTSSTTSPLSQPLPELFILDNGMRVLLLSDHSVPTVNLSGQILAGSEFDSDEKAGLASLTANNLMNGTQSQSALSLAKTLEDRGIDLGFAASREGVNFEGVGLSANVAILIKTLAQVLQNPTFPADQLELSRQRSLSSLKIQLDDPSTVARRTFQQTIYPPNHPFHSFPTEESLKSISQAMILAFYQEHYRPDTTTLALVGDFDLTEVKSLLTQAFGSWQRSGKPPTVKISPVSLPSDLSGRSPVEKRLNLIIPGKKESITYIGYNGISRTDSRFYAAVVLNEILGGDTLSSRLGTEIRDRQGLTYGISSGFAAGRAPGPFLIYMQTSPEDTSKAITSTLTLLKQFREQGITEAELQSAKRSIINSYPISLANPSDVAIMILGNSVVGLNQEELRAFPERIEAVSFAQVQQAIQELIHPDNLVIVTVGSSETIPNKI